MIQQCDFIVARIGSLIVASFLFLIPIARSSAQSQDTSRSVDLSGVWDQGGGMTGGTAGRGFSKEAPPLQAWAMEKYKANRDDLTNPDDKGLDEFDPITYCFPPGAARSMIMPYPFEIVQRAGIVYILFEFGSGIRRIYTDGRKHPDDISSTWMGHSVGTWQGDKLVVDTVGLRPETWIDPTGVPHSDALHIVERFQRPNHESSCSTIPKLLRDRGAEQDCITWGTQIYRNTSSARKICRWESHTWPIKL